MPMFSTIEPGDSASTACADALRASILSGRLSPGDRLPPERELAATFGVNRLTLRSALAQLAAARLLSVRQGSGYVVREWRHEGGPELIEGLVALSRSAAERIDIARDLLAVRRGLAIAVLDRLALGVEPEHVARIRAAVDQYRLRASIGLTPDAAAEVDLDVLRTIADATGSAVFQLCLNPVAAVLRSMKPLREAMYANPVDAAEGYRPLVEWLAAPSAALLPLVVAGLAARDEAVLARMAPAPKSHVSTKKAGRSK